MCKSKKKYNKYNAFAINKVAEKYGYTIRQCLSGGRGGVMAVRVVEDYILMRNEIEKATHKIVNKV